MADAVRYTKPDTTICPWGRPDNTQRVADGIYLFHTPSHGGFWLSPERMAQLPDWAKSARNFCRANNTGPAGNWFEEDVDWCIPAIAFQEEFRKWWSTNGAATGSINRTVDRAYEIMRASHPRTWALYQEAQKGNQPEFIFHTHIERTIRGNIVVHALNAAAALQIARERYTNQGDGAFAEEGRLTETTEECIFAIDLRPKPGAELVTLDEEADLSLQVPSPPAYVESLTTSAEHYIQKAQDKTDSG